MTKRQYDADDWLPVHQMGLARRLRVRQTRNELESELAPLSVNPRLLSSGQRLCLG